MNAPLIVLPQRAVGLELSRAAELASKFAHAEKAENTRKAYRTDFTIFSDWCAAHSTSALPGAPETVAAFLAHEVQRGMPSRLRFTAANRFVRADRRARSARAQKPT